MHELKDKVDFHFHTPVTSVEVIDGWISRGDRRRNAMTVRNVLFL